MSYTEILYHDENLQQKYSLQVNKSIARNPISVSIQKIYQCITTFSFVLFFTFLFKLLDFARLSILLAEQQF